MSIETLELTTPLLVNGEERKLLTYDISQLTINHVSRAQVLKQKIAGAAAAAVPQVAQTDMALHICLGMQAVIAVNKDISEEDLMRLKGFDLNQLGNIGLHFFIPPASETLPTSETQQEVTQESSIAQ